MPGEENPELESAVEQATTEGAGQQQTPSYVDDQGQADRLLQTSGGLQNQGQQQSQQQGVKGAFYNGKYKSQPEFERAHRSLEQQYGKTNNRASSLEKLVMNEKVQEILARDPEARDIMAKLGYEMVEQDTRRDQQQSGGPVQWDENDPRCQVAVLRAEWAFQQERTELQEQIGRKLSSQEAQDIKRVIAMAPRLSWGQAWKLTPHFEREVAKKQEEAVQKAQARAPVARPRPASQALGGAQPPKGKSPIGLKDDEKAEYINDLIGRAQRGA